MFVLIHYNYQPLTYLTYQYVFFHVYRPLYYSVIIMINGLYSVISLYTPFLYRHATETLLSNTLFCCFPFRSHSVGQCDQHDRFCKTRLSQLYGAIDNIKFSFLGTKLNIVY